MYVVGEFVEYDLAEHHRATGDTARRIALLVICRRHDSRSMTCLKRAMQVVRHGFDGPYMRLSPRSSICVLVAEHENEGPDQDLDVEQPAPVPQVLDVVVDAPTHVVERLRLAAATVDLREPRDAGGDLVTHHVATNELAILLVVRHGVGPRADEAHAALQHVD